MLALLSPAKTLDPTPRPTVTPLTQPQFLDDAAKLVSRLRKFSPGKLAALMDISDKLAAENHQRFRDWTTLHTADTAAPAISLFRGDVYQGLQADDLTPADLAYAQQHLRILSGLYGLLRPLDLVQAYRLEMGTAFPTGKPKTLYDFWGDRLAHAVTAAAGNVTAGRASPIVLNLASNEYFRAVGLKRLTIRVITPSFKEERGGAVKLISFQAKRARGLMARFLIERRSTDPQELLEFDAEGYRYNPALSSENDPVFTRPQAVG